MARIRLARYDPANGRAFRARGLGSLRRYLKKMPDIEFNLEDVTDEHDDLAHPIVYWRGRLSVFVRPDEGEYAHRFGGELPGGTKVPEQATLHALLDIDTTQCAALEGLSQSKLPLIFPFRHDGGRLVYHLKDNTVEFDELSPDEPDEDWPYEEFPDILPLSTMGSSAAFEVDREDVEELLWQGFHDVPDDKVVIVIPPREDYGVSLWGEMGDAEMVQCVFVFDPVTGKVTVENQCS